MTSQRGFTLLEVLVATAMLGIVLMAIYGSVAQTLKAADRADIRADINATGRTTVLRLAEEIEGALPPAAGYDVAFIGKQGDGSAPTDALQFTTVIRRVAGFRQVAGGRAIVAFSLDPMEDAPGMYALRRHEELMSLGAPTEQDESFLPSAGDTFGDELGGGFQDQPAISAFHIVDRVAGLRFWYLEPESGEFVEQWDTTQTDSRGELVGLPAAVHIQLFLFDEAGGTHPFSTMVDLPLANIVPTPGYR